MAPTPGVPVVSTRYTLCQLAQSLHPHRTSSLPSLGSRDRSSDSPPGTAIRIQEAHRYKVAGFSRRCLMHSLNLLPSIRPLRRRPRPRPRQHHRPRRQARLQVRLPAHPARPQPARRTHPARAARQRVRSGPIYKRFYMICSRHCAKQAVRASMRDMALGVPAVIGERLQRRQSRSAIPSRARALAYLAEVQPRAPRRLPPPRVPARVPALLRPPRRLPPRARRRPGPLLRLPRPAQVQPPLTVDSVSPRSSTR